MLPQQQEKLDKLCQSMVEALKRQGILISGNWISSVVEIYCRPKMLNACFFVGENLKLTDFS